MENTEHKTDFKQIFLVLSPFGAILHLLYQNS